MVLCRKNTESKKQQVARTKNWKKKIRKVKNNKLQGQKTGRITLYQMCSV